MKLIAHRGNTTGPNVELENSPNYIKLALLAGYDVEVDVWAIDHKWFLGHDEPTYKIDPSFLLDNRLWCHAKNLKALYQMKDLCITNYFWHETDKFTLTSSGYIWTYPKQECTSNSIIVVTSKEEHKEIKVNNGIFGICSDYVNNF